MTPRHYDPIKEEIEQRTERIRRELEAEGLLEADPDKEDELAQWRSSSSIRGAFTRGGSIKRNRTSSAGRTGLLRFAILLILVGGLGGYIYIGPDIVYYILYFAIGVALLSLLFKMKRKRRRIHE